MAGYLGRKVKFEVGDSPTLVEVAGVQEKGLSSSGSAIDVTSDEDLGYRLLLTEAGQNELNIATSGLVKSNVLRGIFHSGSRTKTVRITYLDGGTIEGLFFMASYNEGNPFAGAATFDAEWQSSGAWAYTPPA